MYICEYCGRYLKKKYDKCPACGSTSFKKVQSIGEVVIKEPPKDGYKVNLQNFKYGRKAHRPATFVGLWVVVFGLAFCGTFAYVGLTMTKEEPHWAGYIFIGFAIIAFIGILSMAFAFFGSSKEIISGSNKDINKVKYLAHHGMLIKNLKYKIKSDGIAQGDKTVYRIQVIYEIEKDKTKCFESEPKYLTALGRDDGTVDLLVDPNDYSNYFLDFEIY